MICDERESKAQTALDPRQRNDGVFCKHYSCKGEKNNNKKQLFPSPEFDSILSVSIVLRRRELRAVLIIDCVCFLFFFTRFLVNKGVHYSYVQSADSRVRMLI